MNIRNHPNRSKITTTLASSPTAQLVRETRLRAGLTQGEAARLIFSSERAWQNYESEAWSKNARRMHPAIWILFRLMTGELAVSEVRARARSERRQAKT